ncbi:zonular occludens toxin domain-containing protein [Cerasicoccus fimbriatus]|uniref:zonular occludens toxin domain-containing protein n=1 Tax=Cerasicoccus fimbriatus TaxID=3014554 RepID=UPI0022B3151E|nr:zonular occludens toxin domain-containing protein [Cerasicoccus sp. TK19100]
MIKLLTGKPRNGKGLLAIKIICDALIETDNMIFTNLPIRLTELQDYVIYKGRPDIFVQDRVVELTNDYLNTVIPDYREGKRLDCLRHFFLHRAPNVVLPLWSADEEIDWSDHMKEDWWKPVTFVIDECHKLYPSRDYKKFSPRIEEYFAEHGHMGDSVWLVTQYVEQLDKHCRSFPQEFIVVRNYSKEKHSIFRGPKLFRKYTYLTAPTGSNMDRSVHEQTFTLDKKQAECYHTSRQGGDADKNEKTKGISVYWVIPVGVIILLAVLSVPKLFQWGMDSVLGKTKVEQSDSPSASTNQTPASAQSDQAHSSTSTHQNNAPQTGYYVSMGLIDGEPMVRLESGEIITADDPRLVAIDRYKTVHLSDGTRLFRKPYSPMPASGDRAIAAQPVPDLEKPSDEEMGIGLFGF